MRLFLAAALPEEVLGPLNAQVARFRSRLPPASWVKAESQHVTFAFLGEQPEAFVERLAPHLTTALRAVPPFDAALEGCGFFPNSRHARVGWAGLTPAAPFVATAEAVRAAVKLAGVTIDADFRPHLTLMRLRDPWPPASIELFLSSLRGYRSDTFVADRVTLYSSRLDGRGAIHSPLRTFALG